MSTETSAATGAAHPLPRRSRNYVIAMLTIVYTLSFVDRQIINILAEPIKRDLGLADWQLGAMTGFAFALLYAVAGVPVARLAERGNRSWIMAISLAVWSLFTALSGFAQNFGQILLARAGIGIGEAGCVPAAHSLIGDITPREERGSALATFSIGVPLGSLLGMVLGGMIAHSFGWRAAFLIVGLPGIALAILMVLTVRDPRAAANRQQTGAHEIPSFSAAVRILWTKRSFVWMVTGGSLLAFVGFAQGAFIASFFLRSHAEGLRDIAATYGLGGPLIILGVGLGLILGLGGTFGTAIGGRLGDRLSRKSGVGGYLRVPVIATILSVPFTLIALAIPATLAALLIFGIPAFLRSMWFGPVFAVIQGLVVPRMRATTVAVFLLVMNTVGLGLGPITVGLLSDLFTGWFGPADGLRYALMLAILIFMLAGAFCFWRAGRTVAADMAE